MLRLIDSVYTLHRLLSTRRRYSLAELLQRLECSRATFMRVKAFMVQRLHAPISYSRSTRLYEYRRTEEGAFELPGLWLSPGELMGLSTLVHLLETLEPGLVRDELEQCRERVDRLAQEHCDTESIGRKIKLLPMSRRAVEPMVFSTVAEALLRGRRLAFRYPGGPALSRERTVSPQTLVRYRDNWYLDAWCHLRGELRSFSLSRMGSATVVQRAARRVGGQRLEEHFAAAYGIFSGPARHTAVLRFRGIAAAYAAVETWHPRQKRTVLQDGGVELTFPYGDPRELVKDILAWGEEVEVLGPPQLREAVGRKLLGASRRYAT